MVTGETVGPPPGADGEEAGDGAAPTVTAAAHPALLWLLVALTAAVAAATWMQLGFVHGPQEWQWPYRVAGLRPWPTAVAMAAALGAVITAGCGARSSRRFAGGLLGLAAVVFSLAVVAAQPDGWERVVRSVASRHTFSYLYDAAVAPATDELLADYPRHLERLSMHSRTHPPGPLLLARGVDGLVQALAGEPAEHLDGLAAAGQAAMAEEATRARVRRRPYPERLLHPWTPAVLALVLTVASGLTAWPLHALARWWGLSEEGAALTALAWLLVPARTLFTPSLDQALPLVLTLALLLAARGAWRGTAGAMPAALAGGALAACCLTTFGYLAAAPLVALAALQTPAADAPAGPRQLLARMRTEPGCWVPPVAGLVAGFALAVTGFALLTGFDLSTTLASALATHHEMAVASRDFAVWLRWNPWDFALLLGPALAVLALAALKLPRHGRLTVVAPGWWLLLTALWLSGNVRGEVGRIWLMLMPLACLLAAAAWAGGRPATLRRPSVALLAAQAGLVLSLAANLVFVS